MRPFTLQRDVDESGLSGTGVVAEGIEFSDGVVALRWIVPKDSPAAGNPTSVVFHDNGIASVEKIHGHGGKTRIVFADDDPRPKETYTTLVHPTVDSGVGHVVEPRYLDGVLHGVAVYHDCINGHRSYHWASVTGNRVDRWDLVSEDPLHLEPSLLCRACGDHGFVRDGTWIPV